MKTYLIEIKETLRKVVEVNADNKNQAIEFVNNKYKNEEYILDFNDLKDVNIRIVD